MSSDSVYNGEALPALSLARPIGAAWQRLRARLELLGLVGIAGVLNLWGLSVNGWANTYYSAAVRSISTSWHDFLFASLDKTGLMTIDKPPLSLWMQALAARVFGFHPLSVLIPQALMGIAATVLIYDLTRRRFGRAAGFVAGFALATTPVVVAVSRHNNPDELLVLCCVAALWCALRALDTARTTWLVWTGVLIGLGFETKMAVALMVVPGIAAAYLWVAPRGRLTALRQLLTGGVALAVVALAWPLLVTLTPAADRPWISGTADNSIWSLIFNYNGAGRIAGQSGGPGALGGAGGGPGGVFGGATGIFRLLQTSLGDQAGWLLGFAVLAGLALLGLSRLRRADPRTGWLIAVGGAFVTTAVVFRLRLGHLSPVLRLPDANVAGLGGFSGRESSVTGSWVAMQVRSGRLRWVIVDNQNGGRVPGDPRRGSQSAMDVVAKTCKPVTIKTSTAASIKMYDCQGPRRGHCSSVGKIVTRVRQSIRRRLVAAALAGLALACLTAWPALADDVQSSNWAGYAAHRGGVKFKRVTGTWRQPKATCTPGRATYSSVWVGLGGYSVSSKALEQIGGEVDCNARGKVISSAWYELVPAPSRTIRLKVRPGDELKATVTVIGHQARLQLRNLTRRHTFTRTVHTSAVDVSSAEWILETPSICAGGFSCRLLPLANFGSAMFTAARATTTRGASEPISNGAWKTSKITLAAGGRHFVGAGGDAASASALPSSLSSRRTSFTIIYRAPTASPSPAMARTSVRSAALVRPGRGAGSIRP